MRNFIFNKNSWLFIGNDNQHPDPTFFHVPEFKDGRQILPEFKYELVIEGLDRTTKYLSEPDDEELSDGTFIIETSIYFQISRPRSQFYEKGYSLEQDYSTREIRFLKENDDRWRLLRNKLEEDPKYKKLNYHEKSEIQTKEAMAIEGLVKTAKFSINKL